MMREHHLTVEKDRTTTYPATWPRRAAVAGSRWHLVDFTEDDWTLYIPPPEPLTGIAGWEATAWPALRGAPGPAHRFKWRVYAPAGHLRAWTLQRLLLVSKATGAPAWVDADTAARALNTTPAGLGPMVRTGQLRRRGEGHHRRYDIHSIHREDTPA